MEDMGTRHIRAYEKTIRTETRERLRLESEGAERLARRDGSHEARVIAAPLVAARRGGLHAQRVRRSLPPSVTAGYCPHV